MDHHEREMLQNILELLHQLVGYADAKSDFRPALRFVEDSNVLPFRVPSSDQPTKTDNAKLG